MTEKKAGKLAQSFLFSVPFLYFVSSYASLSLSICLYLMLGVMIYQLKFEEKLYERGRYTDFFLIVGMMTSYFDFLTYPLITLGFPLCVYLFFHSGIGCEQRKVICYTIEWGAGYLIMWAGKWVLADILSDKKVFSDALSALIFRTQSADQFSIFRGFKSVLAQNLDVYMNWCYVLLGVICLLLSIAWLIKADLKKMGKILVPFFLMALYPFFWFFLTQNHSMIHRYFTCRILALTVFAMLSGCAAAKEYSNV